MLEASMSRSSSRPTANGHHAPDEMSNGYSARERAGGSGQSSHSSQQRTVRRREDDYDDYRYRRDYYQDERYTRRAASPSSSDWGTRHGERSYDEYPQRVTYRDEDDRERRRRQADAWDRDYYRDGYRDTRGDARDSWREKERDREYAYERDSERDHRSRAKYDDRDRRGLDRRDQSAPSRHGRSPHDDPRSTKDPSEPIARDEPKLLRRTRWDADSPKGIVHAASAAKVTANGKVETSRTNDIRDHDMTTRDVKPNGTPHSKLHHQHRGDDDDELQQMWSRSHDRQISSPAANGKISPKQFLRSLATSSHSSSQDSRGASSAAAVRSSPNGKTPIKMPSLVERLGIDAMTNLPPPGKLEVPIAARPSAVSPILSPQPETYPVMLSRPDILLPHQLLLPENADKKPKMPDGKAVEPYRVTYDPALDKTKAGKPLKRESYVKPVTDPRNPAAKRKLRRELHSLKWKWDAHSTQPKPPPPPRAVVVTGLSKLVMQPTVTMHFRPFGRIEEAELKMDPTTGQSMGIYYVRFAHDYDDNLRLLPTASSRPQRADKVAKEARAKLDGQKIGSDAVTVILDDAEKTNYVKAYRQVRDQQKAAAEAQIEAAAEAAEAEKRRAKREEERSRALPAPDARETARQARHYEPPAIVPLAPTPLGAAGRGRVAELHRDERSSRRAPARNYYGSSHASSRSAWDDDFGDDGSPWHSRSRYNDDIHHGRSRLRNDTAERTRHRTSKREQLDSTGDILRRLIAHDRPYIFISMSRSSALDSESLLANLRGVNPAWTARDSLGWYVAFDDDNGASRCEMVLANRSIDGYRITAKSRSIKAAKQELDRLREQKDDAADPQSPAQRSSAHEYALPEKTSWTDAELTQDSIMLLLYEMGGIFVRDLRTRVVKPFLSKFLQPDQPGGQLINTPVENKEDDEEVDFLEIDTERPKTFNRAKREEDRLRKIEEERAEEEARRKAEQQYEKELAKAARAAKKNDKAAQARAKAAASVEAAKAAKKARAASPILDLEESGIVGSDDEDYYFARAALEMMQRGDSFANIADDGAHGEDGGDDDDEDELPVHPSGSARTQGYYRVLPEDKAKHVPDRNRAVVDVQQASGLASARDNRADSRRFVQGIEQHKKETATDTDILKFNQLRSRKKQLKFAKSPIHDWGLYAMEVIPAGDMVIEYVGEIVRQQVADEREKMYERQGNFSTYLFRVDDDIVVDATKKGNIARLMNHCCTPNCNAKILTLNGEKRIVLYAKQTILPGQELTYDYKFQGTGDDEDAIACLCGSEGCRRFL